MQYIMAARKSESWSKHGYFAQDSIAMEELAPKIQIDLPAENCLLYSITGDISLLPLFFSLRVSDTQTSLIKYHRNSILCDSSAIRRVIRCTF
jgi:hypothetical protein